MRDNWKEIKLDDIGNIVTGSTPSTKIPSYWDGLYPFYSPADFKGKVNCSETERTLTEEGLKTGRILPVNSVLFTCIGSIGKMAINTEVGISNQQINSVLVNVLNDFKFVYYLLFHFKYRFKNFAPMTTIQIINKTEFGKFKFNLPPLPQQKKIAKILSTVDNVIEKTENAIAKYQAIKQGLMHDLFTRGIDVNTGKLRPTPQDAPALYKESVLGLIPREWEEGFISEVVEENSPVTYGIVQPGEYSQKGVLLIRGKDYISGWAQEADFFKVKKELHNQFKRSTTVSGDILICIVGATYGAVGVVPGWIKEANITQTTARIRCNQKKFSPHFIEYYLKSSFGKLMIEKYVKGSAQPGLNLADVEKFITLYPKNINEQNLIGEKIRTLDKKIQTEQQGLAKYQQLKTGLMQDLLTGRVEVGE
jgi:type I restriction enzyme S subunit